MTDDRTAEPAPPSTNRSSVSRRTFLRRATVAGGGLLAAGLAACTVAPGPTQTLRGSPGASGSAGMATHASSPPPSGGPPPRGWTDMDVSARRVVRRYLGNLVPALKDVYDAPTFARLGAILGADEAYPELSQKPAFMSVGPQLFLNDLLQPLTPERDGSVKVFRISVDEITQQIDEVMPAVPALGYNRQTPGPTIRVNQDDRVRALFTNNLPETTTVHFHGVEFDDFFQDGVPFVTQVPIKPGETYTYDFVARTGGSLMYHSHHNASDQVGRGLLGAFVVEPKENPVAYDREYIWVSNDVLGGFTINGHGFPATMPILAAAGETVLVRFMNEGVMMHPFHSHGFVMDVIARDGHPLGNASFRCDTLSVSPGERWDALIKADRLGVWAFHCHILPHVEGPNGMFGMVTTLIVVPTKEHVDAIVNLLAG